MCVVARNAAFDVISEGFKVYSRARHGQLRREKRSDKEDL
jgi:hypothetical protein